MLLYILYSDYVTVTGLLFNCNYFYLIRSLLEQFFIG